MSFSARLCALDRALAFCRALVVAQNGRWEFVSNSLGGSAHGFFLGFEITTASLHIADFPGVGGPDGSDDRGAVPRPHDKRQEMGSLSPLGSDRGGYLDHYVASILAGTLFRRLAEKNSR